MKYFLGHGGRLRIIVRQTSYALSLLVALISLCFLFFTLAPGDSARIILGPNASEDAVAALRHDLGLHRPVLEQWFDFLKGVVQGDLDRSWLDGRSVAGETLPRFWITAKIGLMAALISLTISYTVNLLAYMVPALRRVKTLVYVGVILPSFYAGVLAVLVAGHWLPGISLVGYGDQVGGVLQLLLPAIVVALYPLALLTRLLEEKLAEQETAMHARAMRAWGYGKVVVFHKALLHPAAVPWLTAWINQLSLIFIASFIVEVIFTIPGIGALLLDSIQSKDFPMLQGIIVINGCFFIAMFWSNELLARWVDHRAR